jgi:hypothetical protein
MKLIYLIFSLFFIGMSFASSYTVAPGITYNDATHTLTIVPAGTPSTATGNTTINFNGIILGGVTLSANSVENSIVSAVPGGSITVTATTVGLGKINKNFVCGYGTPEITNTIYNYSITCPAFPKMNLNKVVVPSFKNQTIVANSLYNMTVTILRVPPIGVTKTITAPGNFINNTLGIAIYASFPKMNATVNLGFNETWKLPSNYAPMNLSCHSAALPYSLDIMNELNQTKIALLNATTNTIPILKNNNYQNYSAMNSCVNGTLLAGQIMDAVKTIFEYAAGAIAVVAIAFTWYRNKLRNG